MQVLFKSRDPQATDLRDLTERRVRFVLRRLGWLVPRAEVQMSDVNGPRGGLDKRCQVELRTDSADSRWLSAVEAHLPPVPSPPMLRQSADPPNDDAISTVR